MIGSYYASDDALRNIMQVRQCAQCGERGEKLRRCKACRSVWFCSGACQTAHWPKHQEMCQGSAAVVGLAAAVGVALFAVVRDD